MAIYYQIICQDGYAYHRKQGMRVLQFLLCELSGTVSKMMKFLLACSSKLRSAALLFIRQQQLGADHRVTNCSLNQQMYPSCTNWWARTIRDRSFRRLKWSTTLWPKIHPAPREFRRQAQMFSGSDHIKSAKGPSLGISCLRSRRRIWSIVGRSGESPPWTQSMLPLTMAPRGRKSNVSQKYFQQLEFPYFLLISSRKPYIMVMLRLSWLPRRRQTRSGYFTLRQKRRVMVSTELQPRSTKSPMKMNLLSGTPPPFAIRFLTSKNCPWMSPAMFTGESTLTMLDSYAKTPFTRLHRARTEDSVIGLHARADQYHCSTLMQILPQTPPALQLGRSNIRWREEGQTGIGGREAAQNSNGG